MCISPPVASKTPPVHPISRCGAAPPTHLAPPTAPAPGCSRPASPVFIPSHPGSPLSPSPHPFLTRSCWDKPLSIRGPGFFLLLLVSFVSPVLQFAGKTLGSLPTGFLFLFQLLIFFFIMDFMHSF